MPTGMLFKEKVEHMSTVNVAVEGLVAGVAMTTHAGDVDVAEDAKFQKQPRIEQKPAEARVKDEAADHRMALASEEERTDYKACCHYEISVACITRSVLPVLLLTVDC